jgi:hypothetical protein
MMAIDGDVAVLRRRGIGRFFEATFLGVWLTGWAIGEVLAVAVLASIALAFVGVVPAARWWSPGASMTNVGPIFVVLFVGVWLTFWTIGGITAGWQFLRDLAGADRIALVPVGVEVIRRAGPFTRTHRFERSDVRRIRIRAHDKALVADTKKGTRVLSDLGSRAERETLCAWLQGHLDIGAIAPHDPTGAAPPGWTRADGEAGEIRLTRPTTGRRTVGVVLWIVTGVVTYAWITQSSVNGVSLWPIVVIALLAFASTWVMWAREAWIVRPGYLERRLQLGSWLKTQTFAAGQLEITHATDSDGDARYTLIVRDAEKRRAFDSALHDDADLVETARWLEAATGFPLTLL